MDGGAWWAAVHGVARSQTWLSNFTFTFHFPALEKEMATHSSVLAWRIPGTGEPGGLPSMGSHRIGHNWSDLAAAAAAIFHCMYVPPLPYPFICQWTSRLLPYSSLENSMDRRAWWATVHGITKSRTRLNTCACMCVRAHTHTHTHTHTRWTIVAFK